LADIKVQILETDAALHKDDPVVTKTTNFNRKFTTAERKAFMPFILHASDVSNPTGNMSDFLIQSYRVLQEFQDQYYEEKYLADIANGIAQPAPFLKYSDYAGFLGGQVYFINSMVLPLWEKMAQIDPKLTYLFERAKENSVKLGEAKRDMVQAMLI